MPTTVADALAAAGLVPDGVVRWGTKPPTRSPGVYIVSLDRKVNTVSSTMMDPSLAEEAFERWLAVRSELKLDGTRPTLQELIDRVGRFWIGDETILYIGKATSLASRVGQYYKTPIGARQPHAGGYFLKLLANIDALWVHYAACPDPTGAENLALGRFVENVSATARRNLHDPAHPFPFANLEWPSGIRKEHGLRGAREPRQGSSAAALEVTTSSRSNLGVPSPASGSGAYRTQRVTAADLVAGHIRIPAAASAPTKSLMPSTKATIDILLRGTSVSARWNPRMGPDRERSGVLRVGAVLRNLIDEDEVLDVGSNGSTIVIK